MSTWCHITLPDSTTHKIEVDLRENARECLDEVCQNLGTLEADYFGLQYVANKGELLWLNLRNPIGQQLQGSAPHRFRLRVKFYVQPHFLQQDSTRDLFYLNVKQDLLEGKIHIPDCKHAAMISALIAQAELGDANPTDPSALQYSLLDGVDIEQVREEHHKLMGLVPSAAKYNLIQDVVSLVSYGVEYYELRDATTGQDLYMGVGPQGIALYEHGTWNCIRQIEYSAIHKATHVGKGLHLHILQDSGATCNLGFKLVSERAAIGLYRCVTEMFSFYCCDTVRSAVSVQFSRDLKGTLASLFNENTSLGKKYVFDIQRTMREAHDHARRRLYKMESGDSDSHMCTCGTGGPGDCLGEEHCCEMQEPRAEGQVQDSTLCCVCMDNYIDCAFTPCNHVVCCSECAHRLDSCPVCRAAIQCTQVAFQSQLPWLRERGGESWTCSKL